MDGPLVSVVIPAHNHEAYVKEAIESVLNQTYDQIELTVIDDGSTDSTLARVRELCEAHQGKIRLLTQENRGLVRTLNRGITESHGTYWCQLASDDLMGPKNIEEKVAFLEKRADCDAVCSDSYRLTPDGMRSRVVPDSAKPNPLKVKGPADLFKAKIFFPSLLFRKSVFERIGNFSDSGRYYEDIEMKPRLLLYGKVGYIDEPLLTWRAHEANTSRNALLRRKEKIVAYEELFSGPALARHRFWRRKILGDEYYKYGRCLIRNGQKDVDHPADWYLRRSLSLHPFRFRAYPLLLKAWFRSLWKM